MCGEDPIDGQEASRRWAEVCGPTAGDLYIVHFVLNIGHFSFFTKKIRSCKIMLRFKIQLHELEAACLSFKSHVIWFSNNVN